LGSATYVSFNYDTILEAAITSRFGYRYTTLIDYIANPTKVFKPHGSTNWIQELPLRETPSESVFYNHDSEISLARYWAAGTKGSVGILDSGRQNIGQADDRLHVPALAIPATYKDAFVMPDSHLEEMKRVLENTTALLIIGWRASEYQFLDLCASHLRGLEDGLRSFIVDHNQASPESAGFATMSNFPQALHPRTTGIWGQGFSRFVTSESFDLEVGKLVSRL
jgi:hypothetical protein